MKKKAVVLTLFLVLLYSAPPASSTVIRWAGAEAGASKVLYGSGGGMLWNRTYGGPGFEWGRSVQVLGDGGFIVAGSTESFGAGETDLYLVRTDPDGNMLWNRTYGGPGFEGGSSVQVLGDGGFIVVGSTYSINSSNYVLLVRTDSEGNMLWNRTYGGPGGGSASSLQVLGDGGYIVAGRTSYSTNTSTDVLLVRTDSDGNTLWNRTYGGPKEEGIVSVHQTSDGGYIVTGYSMEIGVFKYELLLVKTDPQGLIMWNRTYGGSKSYRGCSAQETSNGGYIVCGEVEPPRTIGYTDIYLFRTDPDGNMLWNRTYGGPRGEIGSSALPTGDGGCIIVSSSNSFRVFDDMDIYLVKTDSVGNMLWNRTYGGPGEANFGLSVRETGDGGYIVAGEMAPLYEDQDIYLVRVAPCPVPSYISCSVSANTTAQGDAVTVSGRVTPCLPQREITLTYSLPDGTTLKRTVKTDSEGFFRDEYAPDAQGPWEVAASIEGGVYYEASTSEAAAFTVEEPQAEAPQGEPQVIVGVLVLAMVVVAVVAVVAWLLLRRR